MPKRPNQHKLEDLSRVKFQLAIPERWVFRDKDKDYGIDGEVELFDDKDNAQGLIFYVQLKATESKKDSSIMGVDFSIDTLKYYKKLDIPVLLIRYSKHNDSIYAKWINNVDLFFTKEHAKTIKVKLTQDNLWIDSTSERIEKRLKHIKKLKSGYFNFPIPSSITIKEDKIKEISKTILLTQIKRGLTKYSDFIDNSSKDDSVIDIQLNRDELKINICDLCGCSFHSIEHRELDGFSNGIADDILLGLAMSMVQIGQIDYCGKIIFENELQNRLLEKKELLSYLLPPLFKSSYFEKVLDLIGEIISSEDTFKIDIIANVNVLLSSGSNSKAKNIAINNFFEKSLEKAVKTNEKTQIGIAHYNLGNYYRGEGLHYESVKNYIAAKRFFPTYLKQHYYFRELAGVLFLSQKYYFSSKFYEKSIELGASLDTKGLYADALMALGDYEKAKLVFFDYLESVDNPNEEFHLKAICLDNLLSDDDIKKRYHEMVENYPCKNQTVIENSLSNSSEKQMPPIVISGLSWFNLGISYKDENKIDEALLCFVMAGFIQTNDIETWMNATLISIGKTTEMELVYLIVRTAYHFNGQDYLEKLYSQLEKNNPSINIEPVVEMIEQILPQETDVNSLPTIRYLNEEGIFENIFDK